MILSSYAFSLATKVAATITKPAFAGCRELAKADFVLSLPRFNRRTRSLQQSHFSHS